MMGSWLLVAAMVSASQAGGISNGGFEEVDAGGRPKSWKFSEAQAKAGYRLAVTEDRPSEGNRSVTITSPDKPPQNMFGNLMQSFDAAPWRGKKVRFKASVRTENLSADGRAQLWLRVDRKADGGPPRMGAFDNMERRPIRTDEWKPFEVVAKIDDDAERINVGMLLIGAGSARIDDASFIEADASAALTAAAPDASGTVREEEDPVQPFFNPWLALAAAVMALLAAAHLPSSLFQRFAFRFAFVYWLLYFLPSPFQGFGLGAAFNPYEKASDAAVHWTAVNVLGISKALIPPGGSGDTTYDYVRIFLITMLAAAVAFLWWLVDRRSRPGFADLLRSYLRYTVGLTLLGYGLAKMTENANQFPAPGVDQLAKSYGDSSPMNLLWTFLGASLPYTRFTGFCEMIPAFLLAWRRTSLAGALAAAAVMLNVFVLNMTYDVPVKQFSFHLFFAAVWLALPDLKRLCSLFFGHAAEPASHLTPPYIRGWWKWPHRAAAFALFIFGFLLPAWLTASSMLRPVEPDPPYIGSYTVESFQRGGKETAADSPGRWKRVSLFRPRFTMPGESGPREVIVVSFGDKTPRYFSRLKNSAKDGEIVPDNPLPGGSARLTWTIDGDVLVLKGDGLEAGLKRVRREDYLLVRRGFRWINERPFNR
jgi:hypothetical protein